MKRLISAIVLAVAFLASASVPASADPVMHFTTFTITCGTGTATDTWVIVSKPGSSNVVTFNGMPSNSVSILMGFTVTDKSGAVLAEFHKPYVLNHGDRIVFCSDTDPQSGNTFTAEARFTPGP